MVARSGNMACHRTARQPPAAFFWRTRRMHRGRWAIRAACIVTTVTEGGSVTDHRFRLPDRGLTIVLGRSRSRSERATASGWAASGPRCPGEGAEAGGCLFRYSPATSMPRQWLRSSTMSSRPTWLTLLRCCRHYELADSSLLALQLSSDRHLATRAVSLCAAQLPVNARAPRPARPASSGAADIPPRPLAPALQYGGPLAAFTCAVSTAGVVVSADRPAPTSSFAPAHRRRWPWARR